MHSIRQKFRPKHQVLVLKCYPRTTKGAVDVKPNSSELSYLLYYATTRRSKVQKVGDFLESKTARDVRRKKIGYVQMLLLFLVDHEHERPHCCDYIMYPKLTSLSWQKCTGHFADIRGPDRESASRSPFICTICSQSSESHLEV